MQPTALDAQHECDICHKTYRRRDLVQRHRRHCNPGKIVSKRKSCDACVQTRSKCDLGQPTCSRCSERGLVCEYAAPSNRTFASESTSAGTSNLSHTNNVHDPGVDFTSDMLVDNASWTTNMANTPWTLQVNDWPSVDLGHPHSYFDPSTAPIDTMGTVHDHTAGTASSNWLTQQWNATLPTPPDQVLVSTTPAISVPALPDHTVDGDSDRSENLSTPSLTVAEMIQILRTYPSSFSSDDYHTPLLHRELYGTSEGAITQLPKSTTAVMCALGLRESSNKSFIKRAMTAERQRLVEGFPKSSCIEEWDTIHAMWLYEMMELPDAEEDMNDHWRPTLRTKGLNLPILLKMTRRFCQSHPEATVPSAAMTRDTVMRYAPAPSAWLTWAVGETSRRIVFLAHIVNYLATRDAKTGDTDPYYESLNDEMIWNMPLPCSAAAWNSRTEQEWLIVLQKQNLSFVTESQSVLLSGVFAHEPTVKSLITKSTKDQIRSQFAGNVGFQDSESFRNLIVHCALEQVF